MDLRNMTLDLSVTEFETQVLQASKEDLLLLIGKVPASEKSDVYNEKLTELHNKKKINIVDTFLGLQQKSNGGTDFFQVRIVIEEILPNLDAEMLQVMDCILHLVGESGQDMAAGTVMKPFVDFCAAHHSRPVMGLEIIEDSPEPYASLSMQVLMAGARVDFEQYFESTLSFISSENTTTSRGAILALGRMDYPENSDLPIQAFNALEVRYNEETDDGVLANIIDSVSRLYELTPSLEVRTVQVIDASLQKGDSLALHTASELFGFKYKKLPESLIDTLLKHLKSVNPQHRGTLDNIDYGIQSLLEAGKQDQALDFLEQTLLNNEGQLSISVFNSACHAILKNRDGILPCIATRWLLSGKQALCEAVADIIQLPHGSELRLSIDASEINFYDTDQVYFLARKAVGYLFNKPVSATSIIISIIESSPTSEMFQALSELLLNPLLLNYPGKVGDYLKQRINDVESEETRKILRRIEEALESYMSDLKTVEPIPELQPPQRHREIYARKFQKVFSEAMERAEKESVFLSIIPKSIILYGHTTIDYVHDRDGEARRVENPLKRIGNEIELPRLSTLDPLGISYILAVFRAEQLNKNEIDH
jgi:hypothetical protein